MKIKYCRTSNYRDTKEVEINTIEDLLEFQEKYGGEEIILTRALSPSKDPVLEIYDCCRE